MEPFAVLNFDINEVVGVLLNKHEVITVTSEMVHQPIAAVPIIGQDNAVSILFPSANSNIAAGHSFVIGEGAIIIEGDRKVAHESFAFVEIGFSCNRIISRRNISSCTDST